MASLKDDKLAQRRRQEVADARSDLAGFIASRTHKLGRLFDMLANGYVAQRTYVDKASGEVTTREWHFPPDPEGALAAYGRLAEYAMPRLQRVEQVGDGGGPVQVQVVRGQPLVADQCVACSHDQHEGACDRATCSCVVETVPT